MKAKISLRRFLSQRMVLVAVIPLAISGILIYFFLFPIIRTNISIQHNSFARAVAGQVFSYLQGSERQLNSIAELITASKTLTSQQITDILDSACGEGKFFESIFIAKKESQIISHVGLPRSRQFRRSELLGLDVSGRRLEERGQQGGSNWSKTFLSTLSSRMAVAVTAPLEDQFIVGEITLDNLSQFIKHAPAEAGGVRTLIMDQAGRVVADSDLTSLGRQFVLKSLPSPHSEESHSYDTFFLNGNRQVGTTVKIEEVGWNVLVSQPRSVAYQQAQTVLWIMTTGLIIAFISALVLSLKQGKRLSHLIVCYVDLARQIACGKYDLKWPEAQTLEYHELATNLQLMARQIGEREKELRASENNLSITLNSIGDAVITTDAKGIITRMNPVAEKLTAWKLDDALGKPLPEVMKLRIAGKEEGIFNPAQEVLEKQKVITFPPDTFLEAKNGRMFRIADSGAPIRCEHSGDIGVVIVFRDTTDEHVLQEQLNHSRKMDAIGQLAGGVAHDFNNLLTGICGASELLEANLSGKEKEQKYINIIKNAAERAAALTGKLLAFSRKGKLISTQVNLHSIITETVALLERSIDKKINLQTDLKAEQFMVVGDPSQLHNGILNICINARDAMPDGGTIQLSTSVVVWQEDDCELRPDCIPGKYIQLSIEDTGAGIPVEHQTKVFEPFFTTKEMGKGTGLGLASVYGMVKGHHGDINLYSEPGKGTVFNLFLPLSDEGAPHAALPEGNVIYGRGTILVVDDEEIIRVTASHLLKNLGYTVILAENGQEAVAIYEQQNREIDLILLDMVMPVMDGRETLHKLIAINPDAKVIISSGYTKNISIPDMFSQGLVGSISKPFSQYELSVLIAEVLKI